MRTNQQEVLLESFPFIIRKTHNPIFNLMQPQSSTHIWTLGLGQEIDVNIKQH